MNETNYKKIIENITDYPDNILILEFDDVKEDEFLKLLQIMRRLQNDLVAKIILHSCIDINSGNFEVSFEIIKE